jgi:hypothetical protein
MRADEMLKPPFAPPFAKASGDKQASGDEHLLNDRELLLKIYENTRKTKNYMKWQLYITIVLVVLPLLAAIVVIPMVISSLSNSYGSLLNLQ